MSALKQALRASLASRRLAWLWSPLTRGRLCILVLHRFGAGTPAGVQGLDPNLLDDILSRLRRDGYHFMDLHEAVGSLREAKQVPPRSVIFTVDDGYADFEQGAEVFLHHSCPVTVFLPTGFIDGTTRLWFDEIEYCCLNAAADSYSFEGCPGVIVLRDDGPEARMSVAERLWEHCKVISETSKRRFVRDLVASTGVSLPPRPEGGYAPLTWDNIRRLEAAGVRFAPHTVTHPILSRVDDAQARLEITESWRRVRQELQQPTPILAYPNGTPADFGEREFRIAEEAGLAGAVTTVPEYATSDRFRESRGARFALPRFSLPADPDGACLTASGLHHVARPWRRGDPRRA